MSEFPRSPQPRPTSAGPGAGSPTGAPGSGRTDAEPSVPASVRGAVDLGAATAPAGGTGGDAAASGSGAGAGSYRVALSTATFQQYAEASASYPVVVVLHAPQSPESEQFADTVAAVVDEFAGKLLLGTVDVSAEPQIAQAFQAQTVPTMVALLGGRVVPLVNSTVPEQQVRELLTELVALAQQNGVTGTAEPTSQAEPAPLPPLHQEALEKLEAGDLDGAEASYNRALAENPGDHDAKLALAQVHLLQRVSAMDATAVREAAASNPSDVAAALDVADLDLSGGHVEDAFRRLLTVVRTTAGEDKDAARARLVDLFDVVGADDPRVVAARSQLMRALF
ncbi:putative thioredoxin [Kocuria rhizophila]|uniref:Tetratricopeptide repeat protein n=1 Tax=Kocuria rhizophila TaxID=72000 RepID=A0AAX2SHS7_KOCRH|nr:MULTISPECIES: tetratricopeptide repeat protein [Kocuria]ASE10745.1 co-chaperone YbbN [Kocuria rhizophila]MBK4119613.1 tetratricopeptide repeat protein [Kocuria rhizophila]MBO4145225.1 tetratricopeptide repeat protein [Kocuria rhizophila]MCT1546109.1 tetratricopeptide repeat protein [Kocuria rhizophila]MCT2172696.1 tetratricopeptide repeat protein [Kocuria rhizophila]